MKTKQPISNHKMTKRLTNQWLLSPAKSQDTALTTYECLTLFAYPQQMQNIVHTYLGIELVHSLYHIVKYITRISDLIRRLHFH